MLGVPGPKGSWKGSMVQVYSLGSQGMVQRSSGIWGLGMFWLWDSFDPEA